MRSKLRETCPKCASKKVDESGNILTFACGSTYNVAMKEFLKTNNGKIRTKKCRRLVSFGHGVGRKRKKKRVDKERSQREDLVYCSNCDTNEPEHGNDKCFRNLRRRIEDLEWAVFEKIK